MRKKLLYMLAIVSIVLSLVGTAATPLPAPAQANIKQVTLLQATFMEEKGMIFKFRVVGTFSENELKGNLLVKGQNIKLRCRSQRGADLVQCTAPGGTSINYSGELAALTLNGFGFWVRVPSKKECPTCAYKHHAS